MMKKGARLDNRSTSQASRFLPFLNWFQDYSSHKLKADLVSGVTVALVLIPQSMAYAQLAGLPPYYGLYASLLPPVIGSLFGSSNQLATGPVAVVSLMTSAALAPLATAGSSAFVAYAILLSLVVGAFQLALGLLRLGLLVNFISHPVVNGFTNAAALVIATSQLPKLFGVNVDTAEHHYQTVFHVLEAASHHIHWPTLGIALLAFAIMIVLKWISPKIPYVLVAVVVTIIVSRAIDFENNRTIQLRQIRVESFHLLAETYNSTLKNLNQTMKDRVTVSAALKEIGNQVRNPYEEIEAQAELAKLTVSAETLKLKSSALRDELRDQWFVAVEQDDGKLGFYLPAEAPSNLPVQEGRWRVTVGEGPLDERAMTIAGGGAVVGKIPEGVPTFSVPMLDLSVMFDLLPMAIIISVLGFMEAISIAKRMAAVTGQRIDPNQELIGQGLANIAGSFFRSYPVSGSFSRSAINLQAGAVTGISMVFSCCVVFLTLLFLTPVLYFLPLSVLASIIMMAVFGLINIRGFVHAWKAQRHDGIISAITFIATLSFAPHLEKGIILGVVLSVGSLLFRIMRPNWWLLSRNVDGTYRGAERWNLQVCKYLAVVAFNNSVLFANVSHLEEAIQGVVKSMPELKHVLIVGYAISELDASGEVTLSVLVSRLRSTGYDISFCGLNDHVLAVMHRTGLYEKIGGDHFFSNVSEAVQVIHSASCANEPGATCPLIDPNSELYDEVAST